MIDKLEMFLAVAREQHFGRAAQSLGITQPTLSSGIKQLENQLGVTLIQRGARVGGLTKEGERALVWARQIVGDTRQLRAEMRAQGEGLSGKLRLASIPSALAKAARLTARFCEKYPQVDISLVAQSADETHHMIDNLEIDAGLTYFDEVLKAKYTALSLYAEEYVLVVAQGSGFAERAQLPWSVLDGQNLCLLTRDMQNRRIIDQNIEQANIQPHAQIESNSTVALLACVEEGDWMTVLSAEMANFLAGEKEVDIIPLEKPVALHHIGLISQKRDPLQPILTAFYKEAAAYCSIESFN